MTARAPATSRSDHQPTSRARTVLGLSVLTCLGTASAVKTVPYGLNFGMTRAQIDRIIPLAAGKAGLYPSASPTAGWQNFTVTISPASGLCATNATSSAIPTNEQGVNVLPLMAKLNLTLRRAYGTPTTSPKNVPTSGLMTALNKNPNLLTTRYRTPDGIDVVLTALTVRQAKPAGPLQAQMQLKYSKNYTACTRDL